MSLETSVKIIKPDELNNFYARFEAHNTAHTERLPRLLQKRWVHSRFVADVTWSFKRVNIRKAVGPDSIPGRVLRACAFQLAWVFTDILNIYLSLFVVPACFKKSTIVPIPKKNKITCLNDWRPIALTPIFSKRFEKLVREHICSVLPASLDPLQFTYRSNRPQTMLLPSPCTLLSPTWKIRTPMWGCCSWIIVQHLTP